MEDTFLFWWPMNALAGIRSLHIFFFFFLVFFFFSLFLSDVSFFLTFRFVSFLYFFGTDSVPDVLGSGPLLVSRRV